MAHPAQQPPAYQENGSKLPEALSCAVELPTPPSGEPSSRSRSSTMGSTSISKPIVIPQSINMFYVRSFSPFARAYAPALATLRPSPISQDDFLAFIDGLNDAFMMHPFFQAGFVAGGAVMSAPILPVQIAGGGLQALAALGSGAVTLVRARQYLKKANAELFAPRGLAVRTCTTKRMLQAVGRGGDKKLSFLAGSGGGGGAAGEDEDIDVDELLAQHYAEAEAAAAAATTSSSPPTTTSTSRFARPSSHRRHASTSSIPTSSSTTASAHLNLLHARRLRPLSGSVSPVTFDVPPAPLPQSALKRYSTAPTRWMNGRSARALAAGREKGMRLRREKAAELDGELSALRGEIEGLMVGREDRTGEEETGEEGTGEESGVVVGGGDGGDGGPRHHERMASRELAVSLEEKRAQMIGEIRKAGEKKIRKSDRKEEKMANRVLWIVITRLGDAPTEDEDLELDLSDRASQASGASR
ncbi:uncharacterized protein BKCO1_170006 [Diplodia corticola]|uniref:Uncharacterized protein n=1 Tax=Diplodia corticola TaxID=236234 RepID=A0A1J9R1Z4_9PEZI|nr:uncharacterized protein BKCO1_170006 [Diplodia corticola]OJD35414.1 hypothetical protein BKCO1_170006 [Diplodia corticola]